jgi:hypothetical protein
MPYSSYKDVQWTVTNAEPLSRCQPGNLIQFEGPPDKVIILRNGQIPYLEGIYDPESNTIQREGHYKIRMGKQAMLMVIVFIPHGAALPAEGGWTADDNTPEKFLEQTALTPHS